MGLVFMYNAKLKHIIYFFRSLTTKQASSTIIFVSLVGGVEDKACHILRRAVKQSVVLS